MKKRFTCGLTTTNALLSLHSVVDNFKETKCKNGIVGLNWLKDSLNHNSEYSYITWIPVALIGIYATASMYSARELTWDILVILIIICSDVGVTCGVNYQRHRELYNRLDFILSQISDVLKLQREGEESNESINEKLPNLCTPYTPSVSLQWVIRDGKLINLPSILLTAGDVIVIRPGQQSPAYCCMLQDETQLLLREQVFTCESHLEKLEQPLGPVYRNALHGKLFRVITAPFHDHLLIMRSHLLSRPVSLYSKARHVLFNCWLHKLFLPTFLVVSTILGVTRWLRLIGENGTICECLLLQPLCVMITISCLPFPIVWYMLDVIGNTIIVTSYLKHDRSNLNTEHNNQITFNGEMQEQQVHLVSNMQWNTFKDNLLHLLFGNGCSIYRSSNLLHALSSVTALCCVDKKGILSWPNPTAEKVFFIRDKSLSWPLFSEDKSCDETALMKNENETCNRKDDIIETLDITHEAASMWRLQFDDANWRAYLSSLKPIGIAILLNTCNNETHQDYLGFCDYITCQSLFTKHLVPVTNRRCLCELSREIGFQQSVQKMFRFKRILFTYKNMLLDIPYMDMRYMKKLFKKSKMKFPFPHMVSVISEEWLNNEFSHIFSQGTADIILDNCVEYWNGEDIYPLGLSLRNKMLEIYQRCSLTAYCTAFSYSPFFGGVNEERRKDQMLILHEPQECYVEIPSGYTTEGVEDDQATFKQYYNGNNIVHDAQMCLQIQSKQVFLGMVSMQYQALPNMVQLIELLEKACIRFVHFSKENELRSRVFSEKMGLESGWNCHISLLDGTSSSNSTGEGAECKSIEEQDSETSWSYLDGVNSAFAFDMSNRAKLPCGIENVRPHLQSVDNVPLLVSLFTDCNAYSTHQMLSIMQEYGEIVCVIGSSANINNAILFVQADASIGIEPLYPQVCQQQEQIMSSMEDDEEESLNNNNNKYSMLRLSSILNCAACSVCIHASDPLSIFSLIMQARYIMQVIWNCLQFWLSCVAALLFVYLLILLFILPPIFSIGQLIWITCFIIPILSLSLLTGGCLDQTTVMKKAIGKEWLSSVNIQIVWYFMWCYGSRTILPVITVVVCYLLTLLSACHDHYRHAIINHFNTTIIKHCFYESDYYHPSSSILPNVRHACAFLLLLHYVALSASFLHREHACWHKTISIRYFIWAVIVFSLLFLQVVISSITLDEPFKLILHNSITPFYLIFMLFLSPAANFFISELVKLQEIRVNRRYQKKVRLQFDTKLGMNSPF